MRLRIQIDADVWQATFDEEADGVQALVKFTSLVTEVGPGKAMAAMAEAVRLMGLAPSEGEIFGLVPRFGPPPRERPRDWAKRRGKKP